MSLAGKNIVFTGTLAMKRADAKAAAEAAGASVALAGVSASGGATGGATALGCEPVLGCDSVLGVSADGLGSFGVKKPRSESWPPAAGLAIVFLGASDLVDIGGGQWRQAAHAAFPPDGVLP